MRRIENDDRRSELGKELYQKRREELQGEGRDQSNRSGRSELKPAGKKPSLLMSWP